MGEILPGDRYMKDHSGDGESLASRKGGIGSSGERE